MNPWTILGWLIVIPVALIVGAILFQIASYAIAAWGTGITDYIKYLKSRKTEARAKQVWMLTSQNRRLVELMEAGEHYYIAVPGIRFGTRDDWLKWVKKNRAYLYKDVG